MSKKYPWEPSCFMSKTTKDILKTNGSSLSVNGPVDNIGLFNRPSSVSPILNSAESLSTPQFKINENPYDFKKDSVEDLLKKPSDNKFDDLSEEDQQIWFKTLGVRYIPIASAETPEWAKVFLSRPYIGIVPNLSDFNGTNSNSSLCEPLLSKLFQKSISVDKEKMTDSDLTLADGKTNVEIICAYIRSCISSKDFSELQPYNTFDVRKGVADFIKYIRSKKKGVEKDFLLTHCLEKLNIYFSDGVISKRNFKPKMLLIDQLPIKILTSKYLNSINYNHSNKTFFLAGADVEIFNQFRNMGVYIEPMIISYKKGNFFFSAPQQMLLNEPKHFDSVEWILDRLTDENNLFYLVDLFSSLKPANSKIHIKFIQDGMDTLRIDYKTFIMVDKSGVNEHTLYIDFNKFKSKKGADQILNYDIIHEMAHLWTEKFSPEVLERNYTKYFSSFKHNLSFNPFGVLHEIITDRLALSKIGTPSRFLIASVDHFTPEAGDVKKLIDSIVSYKKFGANNFTPYAMPCAKLLVRRYILRNSNNYDKSLYDRFDQKYNALVVSKLNDLIKSKDGRLFNDKEINAIQFNLTRGVVSKLAEIYYRFSDYHDWFNFKDLSEKSILDYICKQTLEATKISNFFTIKR